MKRTLFLFFILSSISIGSFAQHYPWQSPIKMAWSEDGQTFTNESIFQDSSGVPCIIHWKGDTLMAVFQWFRQPMNSVTWDKVAVKFSFNGGTSWTEPTPIVVNGLPAAYQRPFDPTLVLFANDSIRIFYSSSDGMPQSGLDTSINTYSAKSADGIHYQFEPNPRADIDSSRLIDPAVIHFNMMWHYLSPAGSPQQGAYHFVSGDGFHFSQVSNIGSDAMHNWTGNYMIESSNELRFYGCGPNIWYNSTANGGVWNGYVNTNIQGGDPSVVKISDSSYLMVYVGQPYPTALQEIKHSTEFSIFPNPATNQLILQSPEPISYCIADSQGRKVNTGITSDAAVDVSTLEKGIYFISFQNNSDVLGSVKRFIKE